MPEIGSRRRGSRLIQSRASHILFLSTLRSEESLYKKTPMLYLAVIAYVSLHGILLLGIFGGEEVDYSSNCLPDNELLFVHNRIPLFDSPVSDLRVHEIVKAFGRVGFKTTFVALRRNPEVHDIHRSTLMPLDVNRTFEGLGPHNLDMLLETCYSAVVLMLWYWDWPEHKNSADMFIDLFRSNYPTTPVIIVADDLHSRREKDVLSAKGSSENRWKTIRAHEQWSYRHANLILTMTREDAKRIHNDFQPPCPIGILPFSLGSVQDPESFPQAGLDTRTHLLFVGSLNHADHMSLQWFVKECWKKLVTSLSGVRLVVMGNVHCPLQKGITCIDFQQYMKYYARHTRALVSPVIAGMGLDTKQAWALARGIPVVTTPLGTEGLLDEVAVPLNVGILLANATDCIDFSTQIKRVWQEDKLQSILSKRAKVHALKRFGPHNLAQSIRELARWIEGDGSAPGQISFSQLEAPPATFPGITVALHAQNIQKGLSPVMGSDVTTRYLQEALQRHPSVSKAERFSGYHGKSLNESFDLIIIEGWAADLHSFLRDIRLQNPKCLVLHWCLSTWNLQRVLQLPVDGYLTNSRKFLSLLQKNLPTAFIPLGAPHFKARPNTNWTSLLQSVVYLGQPAFHKKTLLREMLNEAAPHNLAIYGSPEWAQTAYRGYYKGILPIHNIGDLYFTAKVVLAVTVDAQKYLGMINNRVYEALAAGAIVLSDHFEELEETFGTAILYHRSTGDARRILGHLSRRPPTQMMRERARQAAMMHTYDARVASLFKFIRQRFPSFMAGSPA